MPAKTLPVRLPEPLHGVLDEVAEALCLNRCTLIRAVLTSFADAWEAYEGDGVAFPLHIDLSGKAPASTAAEEAVSWDLHKLEAIGHEFDEKLERCLKQHEELSRLLKRNAGKLKVLRDAALQVPQMVPIKATGGELEQAKKKLKQLGLSQRKAAPLLGVSFPHLNYVLNGHRESRRLLRKIAELEPTTGNPQPATEAVPDA